MKKARGKAALSVRMEKGTKAPQRLTKIGKEMSRILRHDPPPGAMDKHGWVPVETLMAHLKSKPTYNEVLQAVAIDNKVKRTLQALSLPAEEKSTHVLLVVQQRFVLDEATVPTRVRAAQGHSVQIEEPLLIPIQQADDVDVAVHVTSQEG